MIRHILLLLFLYINLNNLYGKNVDSLSNQLNLLKGIEKIDLLTELSWEMKYTNQKKALAYGLEGLELARIFSKKESESKLLKNVAAIYYLKSDLDQSQGYCTEALKLFQQQKNTSEIANISNLIGLINNRQGKYDLALEAFEKAITIYNAIGDSTKILDIKANIGHLHLAKGAYKKAIPLFERVVLDARQKKDKQKIGLNIHNLGIVYTKLGDYPTALKYLYEAAEIHKSLENDLPWIKSQNEIGLIFRRLDMIDEAILIYQSALKQAKEIDNKDLIGSLSNNLGLCYFHKDQFDKALECFYTSLEIRQSLNILNVGHILNNIGRCYNAIGRSKEALDFYNQALERNSQLNLENKMALDWSNLGALNLEQGNYIESEKCLLNAHSVLDKSKEIKELITVTKHLSTLYNYLNRKEKEEIYNNLYQNYSDSLYNKEKMLATSRIIIREQLKEKNEQINKAREALAHLEKENNTAQNSNKLLLGLLFFSLVIYLVGIYFYRKVVNLNKRKLSENLLLTESEKHSLNNSLEKQNKEMILFSLEMVQNKELLKSLKIHLATLSQKHPNNIEVKNILNKIKINDLISKDWAYFNEVFNVSFPNFTKNLRQTYPNLSRKELQHCALIKLNIAPAEAANIMGITTESIHSARYRLRKKFNLIRQESLEDVILAF